MKSNKTKGKGESDETAYEVNLDSVMVKSFSTSGSADDADSFDFKDFSDEGEAKGPKEWIPIETMSPPGPIGPSSQSARQDTPDYIEWVYSGGSEVEVEWTY